MAARKSLKLKKGVRIAPPHPHFRWFFYKLSSLGIVSILRGLFFGYF